MESDKALKYEDGEIDLKPGQVIHSCRACGKKVREGEQIQLLMLGGIGQDGRIVPQPVFACPNCRTVSIFPMVNITPNKIVTPELRIAGHG